MLYLMGCLAEKGQSLMTYLAVRKATDPHKAQRLIAGALPPVVASILERLGSILVGMTMALGG